MHGYPIEGLARERHERLLAEAAEWRRAHAAVGGRRRSWRRASPVRRASRPLLRLSALLPARRQRKVV